MSHADLLSIGVYSILLGSDRVVRHGKDKVIVVLADIDIELIISGRRIYDFLSPWFHALADTRGILGAFAVEVDLRSFEGGVLDVFGLSVW